MARTAAQDPSASRMAPQPYGRPFLAQAALLTQAALLAQAVLLAQAAPWRRCHRCPANAAHWQMPAARYIYLLFATYFFF